MKKYIEIILKLMVKLTTFLWEEENTICYQIYVNGILINLNSEIYLKGIWIPFLRAKLLATQHNRG